MLESSEFDNLSVLELDDSSSDDDEPMFSDVVVDNQHNFNLCDLIQSASSANWLFLNLIPASTVQCYWMMLKFVTGKMKTTIMMTIMSLFRSVKVTFKVPANHSNDLIDQKLLSNNLLHLKQSLPLVKSVQ